MLKELFNQDQIISQYSSNIDIVEQGIGPLLEYTGHSTTLTKKISLLQQAMLPHWLEALEKLSSQFSKPVIVFKGYALCHSVYPENWLRPFADIDVFIHIKHYPEVEKILLQHEFKKIGSRKGQFISHQNSFTKQLANQSKITFDVHWQLNNRPEFHSYFPFEEVLSTSDEQKMYHTLDLASAFVLSAFHYYAHRSSDRKHIWLYDMALLWNQMDRSIQFKTLDLAKKTKQLQICHQALNQLKTTFNLSDFDHNDSELQEKTDKYLKKRTLKIHDFKIRLSNTAGFINKCKYIGEYLFQPYDYVQQRYGLNSNKLIWLYYPLMWAQDILKLFKKT
ncbi:MAG: nucleotidyltransferase family protein [Proteobacteria bacterium]|nr:nucleotidyltransferase family protein [Pseudomonadota bacterium]